MLKIGKKTAKMRSKPWQEKVSPVAHDISTRSKNGEEVNPLEYRYWLMGQAAGAVKDVQPAADIMNEMIDGAIAIIETMLVLFQKFSENIDFVIAMLTCAARPL